MTSLKCWLLLCCVAASHQLSIKEFEVPNAIEAGQNVELKCSYELNESDSEDTLYIKWLMAPLGTDYYPRLIYHRLSRIGRSGFAMMRNIEIKENDTIVLLNVTPAESGIYHCEVSTIQDDARRHQELVVFTKGTGPELNVTTIADGPDKGEEDDVLIECAASGVAPRPDFVLTVNGTKFNMTKHVAGPDANGLYEIYGNTTVSMAEADGAEVRCELVFIHPNVKHQAYVASKFLSYPSASGQLRIKGFEVPNAIQVGQDVELKCGYKLNEGESEEGLFVKWWFTPSGTDTRRLFYLRMPGADIPGFSIQHHVEIKERNTIVLLNVTPAESGIYECEVSNIDETRRRQELIVFTKGTGPELNVTTIADGPDEDEEEDVLIECAASGVAPRPDFVLTVKGRKLKLTKHVEGPDANGLYEIYGNTTVSMAAADGAEVRCELVFIHPNVKHQTFVASKLLSYPSANRQLRIKGFEVPNAIQAGQDVELKCGYKLNEGESAEGLFVKWWFTPSGTDTRKLFYLRMPGADIPGFSIQHHVEIKERDTIVLLNVTPAESGIYECEVSNFDETRRRQELIVFTKGTGPMLNMMKIDDGSKEEDVVIECAASDAAPEPDYVLTVNGTKVNLTKYVVGPTANGLYVIFGNATVSIAEADGAEVSCELGFIHPNVKNQTFVVSRLFNPIETHGNKTARLQDMSQQEGSS